MEQQAPTNWLKSLSPLTLLTICFCMIATVFFQTARYALGLFAFIAVLSLASGVLGTYCKNILKITPILLMIFLIQGFLVPGGAVLWQFWVVKLHAYGLARAIRFCSKLIIIAGSFFWFFEVTTIKRLMISLKQKGMPNTAAYVVLSTFQMVSQLSKRSRVIMDAQRSRGIETEGSLIIRIKAFLPSLGPLVISSLLSTEERALTLEARGFSAPVTKTSLISIDERPVDWVLRVGTVVLAAVIIVMGVRHG